MCRVNTLMFQRFNCLSSVRLSVWTKLASKEVERILYVNDSEHFSCMYHDNI